MPLTATVFPTSSAGWNSSSNANASDGATAYEYAWRGLVEGFYDNTPSPYLVCQTFTGITAGVGAGDTVNGIEVEVKAKQDSASRVQLVVFLARGGVQVGNQKTTDLDTTLTSYVFGSAADVWGGAWNGGDLANLQVVVWCQRLGGSGTAQVDVDFVRVNATYAASTPDPFTFTDVTGATQSTLYTSDSVSISGISSGVPVSLVGGEYEKNNSGTWTSSDGTAVNGDTFRVRITSSASANTAVTSVLTVGGISDTYSVTTANTDTTPNAFGWNTVYGAEPGLVYSSSDSVTVAGINAAAAITVASGLYSVNGGAYTAAAGTVNLGDVVRARVTSGTYGATATCTVTIGGVAGTFSTVTRAADTTPAAFAWVDVAGGTTSTVYESNIVTITGIEAAANVTFATSGNGSAHEYKIAAGAWTAIGATTITNGQALQVRMTSSANPNEVGGIIVTVGGVSDTYSVSTGADTVPTQFTFTDRTNAIPSVSYESDAITVLGVTAATNIAATVVGGEMKINAGAWVASGDVVLNDTVTVRGTASAIAGGVTSVTLRIGGISDTFSITSRSVMPQDF